MKPSVLAIFVVMLILASSAFAEVVRYQFKGSPNDGAFPLASLVHRDGSFYGTTYQGGLYNLGTVFELTPPSTKSAAWTETVLYSFQGGTDGSYPYASVIFDKKGNLYGETSSGGGTNSIGTVFQLTPPTTEGGSWTFSVIHSFVIDNSSKEDGYEPQGGLTFGWHGFLYGTTTEGGAYQGGGTVFELGKLSNGSWRETVLYRFPGLSANGDYGLLPWAGLIADKAGNLYGTTSESNDSGHGIVFGSVFELSPPTVPGSGIWNETILYQFRGGSDAAVPLGKLIFDSTGNLYGTTSQGGGGSCSNPTFHVTGCGTVFELSPSSGGTWTERVLYSFTGGSDGAYPRAEMVFDQAGNLYGTTGAGARVTDSCSVEGISGCGTVFKLSPPTTAGEAWSETTLHDFGIGWEGDNDGANPGSGLIFGQYGALYGTTSDDPSGGYGTVFAIQP